MAAPSPPTLGVILAGGRARRMGGGDKPMLRLGGRTLLARVAERLAPQCEALILSANGDPARFAGIGLPVVPDPVPGHAGPLAGILAALEWAAESRPDLSWVVSVPGDTPFIPADLVSRLHQAREAAGCPLACAVSGSRLHPAVGVWPVRLRENLRRALTDEGQRKVQDWMRAHGVAEASWPSAPSDPFFNINTPEDMAQAAALSEEGSSMAELDLTGLKCPLPVLRTRKALLSLKPGDVIRVVCTDPLAAIDLPNLLRETGDVLEQQSQEASRLTFLIRKAGSP